jgi:hypothetical protein
MMRLDVHYLFNLAGGPKALLDLLAHHGQAKDLPYPTVQMWFQRDTLPAKWVAPVLYTMAKEGVPLLTLFTDDEELEGVGFDARPGC